MSLVLWVTLTSFVITCLCYSNSFTLALNTGYPRCLCTAVMRTALPVLTAVWHGTHTALGTDSAVPDSTSLARGKHTTHVEK